MEEAIARFVPAPSGAELFFDKKAHILIAKNTRENLSRVEELIEALDVSPPQVLIEARFISTGVNDLRELGIDWLMNSPITVSRKGDAVRSQIDPASIKFSPFAGASQGLNFTYQGLLTDPMFSAVIHALETTGKSQTLSVPRVTTVNNRPAKIRIGEDFRYFEEYEIQQAGTTTTTDDRGVTTTTQNSRLVPVGTPQLEELGIQLEVTPSVGADLSTITLHMVPEISEFVRFEVYETSTGSSSSTTNGTAVVKLPVFRRSTIETEVIVGSGETVVMGGLITSTESRKRNKVPLLGSLPLLGALFQNDEVTQQRQNLLIFVTATLLSSRGEDLVPLSPEPQTSAQGAAGT
jgi:type II secretory pathway component GspD/PulD (secretin)